MNVEYVCIILYSLPLFYSNCQVKNIKYSKQENSASIIVKAFEIERKEELDVAGDIDKDKINSTILNTVPTLDEVMSTNPNRNSETIYIKNSNKIIVENVLDRRHSSFH